MMACKKIASSMFFMSLSLVGMNVDFSSVKIKVKQRTSKITKGRVVKEDGFGVTLFERPKRNHCRMKRTDIVFNCCSSFKNIDKLKNSNPEINFNLIDGLFICNSNLLSFENSYIKELLPNIRVFQLSNNKGSFDFQDLLGFKNLETLQVNSHNGNQSFQSLLDLVEGKKNMFALGMYDCTVGHNFFAKLEGCLPKVDCLTLTGIKLKGLNNQFMSVSFVDSCMNNFYDKCNKECLIEVENCCEIRIPNNVWGHNEGGYFIDNAEYEKQVESTLSKIFIDKKVGNTFLKGFTTSAKEKEQVKTAFSLCDRCYIHAKNEGLNKYHVFKKLKTWGFLLINKKDKNSLREAFDLPDKYQSYTQNEYFNLLKKMFNKEQYLSVKENLYELLEKENGIAAITVASFIKGKNKASYVKNKIKFNTYDLKKSTTFKCIESEKNKNDKTTIKNTPPMSYDYTQQNKQVVYFMGSENRSFNIKTQSDYKQQNEPMVYFMGPESRSFNVEKKSDYKQQNEPMVYFMGPESRSFKIEKKSDYKQQNEPRPHFMGPENRSFNIKTQSEKYGYSSSDSGFPSDSDSEGEKQE